MIALIALKRLKQLDETFGMRYRRFVLLLNQLFDLLRIPIFTTSVATSIISFTAQMLVMVGMPFMLVNTFEYNAVGIGLLMTAWPLAIVFVAPLAGLLINHVHPGILGGIGLTILSVGCFLLSFIPADTDHFGLVWRLLLCGMGFGFFQSPNNHLLLSSAPPGRTGSASGMLATARLTGQTIGAALVAMLFHLFGQALHTTRCCSEAA